MLDLLEAKLISLFFFQLYYKIFSVPLILLDLHFSWSIYACGKLNIIKMNCLCIACY